MITILLVLVLTWVLWRLYLQQSFWQKLGIAEAPSLPLLGNFLPVVLRKKPLFQLHLDIYNSRSDLPYIGLYNFRQPVLLIRDANLIELMLKTHARNFEDHGLLADPSDPLSMNLFYLTGEKWKWTRNKLRTSFSTPSLKEIYPRLQDCVDEFLDGLDGTINLSPCMNAFACNVIAKTVFCLDDATGFVEASHKVYNLSGWDGIKVFLRTFIPRTALALGIKTVPRNLEEFYRNIVSTSPRKPGSFLDILCKLRENESDFSEDLMLAQFFVFILAGFETTATALTYSMYLLAKHPEVQDKARLQVEQVFQKEGLSFESFKDVNYLDFVINEALRLYTPITSILRVSEEDFQLPCGAILPRGTSVNIPYLALHRDPRYFPDPLIFKPERWENPQPVFYPFGLGPRNCLGMKLALLELKVFLSCFLSKYSMKLNPQTPEELQFEPTSLFLHPKLPILIDVKRRN